MKVIVGLGNPGPRYAGTRHNIGFDAIDYLAASPNVGPMKSKFESLIAECREGLEQVLLVKPETFMNLSGRAVRQILDFYKVPTDDLLVVCDDYNLPLGKLRLRASGSHGGQNGLRNIEQMLATDVYPRLRIGVGAPRPGEAVDHVLGKWKPGERDEVEKTIARAAQAILTFIGSGLAAAMNRFNAPDEPPKKKPRPAADTAAPAEGSTARRSGGRKVAPPAAAGGPGETPPEEPR